MNDILLATLAILVPALVLWGIFVARSGATGARRRVRIGIPQALRPGAPDEVLEGPRLERIEWAGFLSAAVLALSIVFYWLPESRRYGHFEERFHEESVERGSLIYQAPPVLPEEANPQEFREQERAIALGMACATCHGPKAGGGQVQFTDPTTGKKVMYNAPPLNNVFQRWDEEIVRFTIERGRPGTPMPTWGVEYGGPMTEQMVDDVIAWLESLPGNQRPPPKVSEECESPSKGNAEQCGQEIFEARCAVCHGDRGQGKEAKGTEQDPWFQGMALWKGDVRHLTKQQHLFTIRGGRRFGFMPQFSETPPQGIPVPPYPLTDAQIEAVMAYERTL